MKKIKELKEYCKQEAHNIRTWNRAWREHQRSGKDWQAWAEISKGLKRGDSSIFRHNHIAYCLLRGTPYELIEPKVNVGNEPDWQWIEGIKQHYTEVADETPVCSSPA